MIVIVDALRIRRAQVPQRGAGGETGRRLEHPQMNIRDDTFARQEVPVFQGSRQRFAAHVYRDDFASEHGLAIGVGVDEPGIFAHQPSDLPVARFGGGAERTRLRRIEGLGDGR